MHNLFVSLQSYDVNLDGQLNREEFEGFIQELSKEALTIIRGNVILELIVVPMVALVTKRAQRGFPEWGRWFRGFPIQYMHRSLPLE